jgi:uncharacterized protein
VRKEIDIKIAGLNDSLRALERVSVAVSGGVDSVTLAHAAHSVLGKNATMFHAISPAVPSEATDRVERYAKLSGWALRIVDAGEFSDRQYINNPVNRCYFCKSNLYGAIRSYSSDSILSGTNLDDLADYRPGLSAAETFAVRHPYVEQKIDKTMVREIARSFALDEMADLPASPCLSSRIETGIPIDAAKLRLVHAVERYLSEALPGSTVRCRFRKRGLVVELDKGSLKGMNTEGRLSLEQELARVSKVHGYNGSIGFDNYRMGSAFLHDQ